MNRKIFTLLSIFMISFLLCSCSNDTNNTKKFMNSFEPELTNYFASFSKEACDVTPKEITPGALHISSEELKNTSPSFETYLNDENFIFKIGFTKDDGSYNEEEINDMIKYALEKNLTIDFYFNNDDYTIYKIRKDSVTIDIVTGKDGGLYHEEREYEIQ